jgi:ferredoxin-NADP reductase
MSRNIDRIELRVEAMRDLSPSLKHLRLVPAHGQGQLLAPASAGSHIVLTLRDASRTFRNAYPLTSKPGARDAYEIIVRRVPQSRGGSHFIHRAIAPGAMLEATQPANLFAPVRTARRHLLIAAGVGITPFLSYLPELDALGQPFELHYCARDDEQTCFASWFGERPNAHIYQDLEEHRLDVPALLRAQPVGTQLYVCGPDALMDHVLASARDLGWPASTLHAERFGAPRGGTAFVVSLARSGVDVHVPGDVSLLDALEAAGVRADSQCRGGACGVCKTSVFEGCPEHRDYFLSAAERSAGRHIMPCVSRAIGERLVLDL